MTQAHNQQCFSSFVECFKAFAQLIPLDLFDGKWFAPLADQICTLLSRLAALADADDNGLSEIKQINVDDDDEEKSDYPNLDAALRLVRDSLGNKMNKSNKPPGSVDSRKYVRFIVSVHVIKLWFKVGNYKQCKASFDFFEREIK